MNQPTHFIMQYSHKAEYLHLDMQHDYFLSPSSIKELEDWIDRIKGTSCFKVVAIFKISLKNQKTENESRRYLEPANRFR